MRRAGRAGGPPPRPDAENARTQRIAPPCILVVTNPLRILRDVKLCYRGRGGAAFPLNVVLMSERGIRPERAEIDAAALELLARHGSQILATARRYAATPEDAEDACQRGLEILLTKAPSTSEEELIPGSRRW